MVILELESRPLLAVRLDGAGGMAALDAPALRHWQPGQGALWVHLNYTDDAAVEFLESTSDLPEDIVQALCAEVSRPRRVSTAQGLLTVLRAVNLNDEASPEDMVSVRIWLQPQRIITARQRGLQSAHFVLDTLRAGDGPHTPAELFCLLFERITELAGEVVADLDEAVDDLEEQTDAGDFGHLGEVLPTLRRRSIALRRHLAPQREAMLRLLHDQDPRLADAQIRRLREATDVLVRQVEEVDAMRERIGVLQDQLSAHHSAALERRSYALTALAALFVPLGFLTGLLGINVGGIPGADTPHAFALVSGLCVAIAALGFGLLRRRGWL